MDVDYRSIRLVKELHNRYGHCVVIGLDLHLGASSPLFEAVAVNLLGEGKDGGRQLFPRRPLTVSAPIVLFGLVGRLRDKGYDVAFPILLVLIYVMPSPTRSTIGPGEMVLFLYMLRRLGL